MIRLKLLAQTGFWYMVTTSQQGDVLAAAEAEIISLQSTSLRFEIKTTTFPAPAPIEDDKH